MQETLSGYNPKEAVSYASIETSGKSNQVVVCPMSTGRVGHNNNGFIDMKTAIMAIVSVLLSVVSASAYSNPEIRCLALNMYQEASGEGVDGMKAVGYTTLRRTYSSTGDKKLNVCSVVYRAGAFSWTKSPRHIPKKEFTKARKLAYQVIHTFSPRSWQATHFHSVRVKPYWTKSMRLYKRVGGHLFYISIKQQRKKHTSPS